MLSCKIFGLRDAKRFLVTSRGLTRDLKIDEMLLG